MSGSGASAAATCHIRRGERRPNGPSRGHPPCVTRGRYVPLSDAQRTPTAPLIGRTRGLVPKSKSSQKSGKNNKLYFLVPHRFARSPVEFFSYAALSFRTNYGEWKAL